MKRFQISRVFVAFFLAMCALGAVPAVADEPPERTLVIQNHRFDPSEVEVPAGVRIKLIIDNRDDTAEEFESHDLRREKVVAGKSKITVWVGPLKPGVYTFVGEFHEDTAFGELIAK